MKPKKEQIIKSKSFSLKFYFNLLIVILVIGYPIYFLIKSGLRSYQLSNESKLIKAVVIDEENYVGHSPVEHRFYYSYEFIVDGKAYRGNTKSSRFKVGDSVEVKYSTSNPEYNEIIKSSE